MSINIISITNFLVKILLENSWRKIKMIKISHLDHLVLTVKDIDKTVDSYTKILAMKRNF